MITPCVLNMNTKVKGQVRGMITTSTVDTPADLRFFPRPKGPDIHVPVFSLSPGFVTRRGGRS